VHKGDKHVEIIYCSTETSNQCPISMLFATDFIRFAHIFVWCSCPYT